LVLCELQGSFYGYLKGNDEVPISVLYHSLKLITDKVFIVHYFICWSCCSPTM